MGIITRLKSLLAMHASEPDPSGPSYKVAAVEFGKCAYFVDLDPYSRHGGPIAIWQIERNGNRCGAAHSVEAIENNPHLARILKTCNCLWLLDTCRGLSAPDEIVAAFKRDYSNLFSKQPELDE